MEKISLFTEEVIRRWFLDNRPDVNVDIYLINDIFIEIKDDIENLDQAGQRLFITEFLSVNYDPIIVNIIKELVENSDDEDFVRTRKDWRGMGIYNMEIGSLTKMVIAKGIPENNITFESEEGMGYAPEMKGEIYEVIEKYIKEEWS